MKPTNLLRAKNAFELLSRLPQHGLGSKLSRTSWTDDCFWTITKVRLSQDGKHGSAWGTLTWRGQPQPPASPTALSGPLKPVWRVVANSGSSEQWQSMLADTLREMQQTAAAAAEGAAAAGEDPAAAAAEEPAAGAAEQAASA